VRRLSTRALNGASMTPCYPTGTSADAGVGPIVASSRRFVPATERL
jgi:hypothetical protein